MAACKLLDALPEPICCRYELQPIGPMPQERLGTFPVDDDVTF